MKRSGTTVLEELELRTGAIIHLSFTGLLLKLGALLNYGQLYMAYLMVNWISYVD